jgi:glycosyltransferase involved in cell wall biosynthesis
MATSQYLTELALALHERGHQVTVVTSQRAYDNPDTRFARHEIWCGITIHRVGSTRFGKGAKWKRAADFASFMLACCFRLLTLPRHDVVLALTSPPLISFIGAWLARLRRSRFVYWVMDFNPDEAIAAGWLRADSLAGRGLDQMSRFSLRRADTIIALDRFMRDRIVAKGIYADKIAVLPPWAHDDQVHFDAAGRARFREQHGLTDKFVVMYSGNHSPVHPLDTLLDAARRLAGQRDIVFAFIGGGSEFKRIQSEMLKAQRTEEGGRKPDDRQQRAEAAVPSTLDPRPSTQRSNLFCLPYQPLAELAASLSAADLHVVVMGNAFVGLVHPCKIYNILAVAAPVLYIGPEPSHVTEILANLPSYPSLSVRHGDGAALAQKILALRSQTAEGRGPRAEGREPTSDFRLAPFSKQTLLPQFLAVIENQR